MSSKCKRLNKTTTNHYHDSGSKQLNSSTRTIINSTTTSSISIKHHHHIHLREPPLLLEPIKEEEESLGARGLVEITNRNNKTNRNIDTLLLVGQQNKRTNKMLLGGVNEPMRATKMRQLQRGHQKRTSLINFNNSKLLAFLSITSLITLTAVVLLFLANGVQSLNCYTCSSADNPGCDEAFTGRANITDTDCEKQIGRPAKVCRKLVQYIEHKKVVIRSCGFIDEHDEKDRKPMCYKRSGTFAIMMESCICYEDNCNHSASLVPNQSILLLLSGFSLLFIYIFKQ